MMLEGCLGRHEFCSYLCHCPAVNLDKLLYSLPFFLFRLEFLLGWDYLHGTQSPSYVLQQYFGSGC